MLHEKIVLIGGGVMCEAIVRGLLDAGVQTASGLTIAEPVEKRRAELTARHGIVTVLDNAAAARDADVLLLSIKPQHAPAVLKDLRPVLRPNTLVISIMAGFTARAMQSALGEAQPIVRVMPNTPAQVGMGVSGWFATPAVSTHQQDVTRSILGAMGAQVQFDGEHYIDMVTGVSGSGPAFVFLFAEAFMDAAVRIGIARPAAETLVLNTLKGSIALMEQGGQHPAQLKNQVTSAGGTTAAGLHALEQGAFRATIENAIEAAWRRAQELGAPGK